MKMNNVAMGAEDLVEACEIVGDISNMANKIFYCTNIQSYKAKGEVGGCLVYTAYPTPS